MMAVVVTTGVTKGVKLQSNRHHQQTNTQLFTGQMPFLSPHQRRQSTAERSSCNIPRLLSVKWWQQERHPACKNNS